MYSFNCSTFQVAETLKISEVGVFAQNRCLPGAHPLMSNIEGTTHRSKTKS